MTPSPIGSGHFRAMQFVLLGGMWLVLALVVIPTWGWTYWDFGDGNYLYAGRRLNDGLVPYRDILAPQPPLHLLSSALSQRVGGWLGNDLYGARAFSLLVRMAQSLMVFLVAHRVFRCGFRALAAAAIHLILPIGFWWSLGIQSENLEIVFLLAALWGILRLERRGVAIAGAASALAMHCNMTAVPYFLVNALFLACRRRGLLAWYVGTGLGVWGMGAAATAIWCGAAYWDNVLFNQAGSFPRGEILALSGQTIPGYVWMKWSTQGLEVLRLEAPYLLAAVISLALGARETSAKHESGTDDYLRFEFAAWSAAGLALSICFTAKGGTVNYIFVLGEPAVALFAADALVRFARAVFPPRGQIAAIRFSNTLPALRLIFGCAGIGLLIGFPPAIQNLRWTLDETQTEMPAERTRFIVDLIEEHSQPGEAILAPPFFAYASGRTVAAELAENYLWQIKWMNETFDNAEGEGVLKMNELAGMLRRQEIPIVLLDMKQTGTVPAIKDAIERHYTRLEPDASFRTRNTTIGVYVRRGERSGIRGQ